MQSAEQNEGNCITPADAYTLGFRLIASRRAEPIIDTEACADWLATQPPSGNRRRPVRRGSFANYALEFPEAED